MSKILVGTVTVNWEADTPLTVRHSGVNELDETGYGRIEIGGQVALWPCYAMTDDAAVVTACDNMIAALHELRSHALARLVKEDPSDKARRIDAGFDMGYGAGHGKPS